MTNIKRLNTLKYYPENLLQEGFFELGDNEQPDDWDKIAKLRKSLDYSLSLMMGSMNTKNGNEISIQEIIHQYKKAQQSFTSITTIVNKLTQAYGGDGVKNI